MAGLSVPDDMQGKSIVPLFSGSAPKDWPPSLYYHYYEFAPPHWVLPNYGIRTERYKLISYYTVNQWELFDLERDPDEMDSLFSEKGMEVNPQYADHLKELLTQLKELRQYYRDNTEKQVNFRERDTYN